MAKKSSKISAKGVSTPFGSSDSEPKKKKKKSVPKAGTSGRTSSPKGTGSKKSKEKSKTTGSTQRRRKLDPLREQLAILVDEANARVRDIEIMNEHGQNVTSRALLEAMRTLPPSRREDPTVFRSDLPRTRDINRELARVQAFLSDYTSFSRGAENFTKEMAFGLFGAQFRQNGGQGYDSRRVSGEDAQLVFDVYHRVIEMGGGYDRVIGYFKANSNGLIEYGSQQLINAIYDMVVNMPFNQINYVDEREREEAYIDHRDMIIGRAYEVVESMIKSYSEIASLQRSGEDYGHLNNDPDYFARFNHWHWVMQRAEYRGGK